MLASVNQQRLQVWKQVSPGVKRFQKRRHFHKVGARSSDQENFHAPCPCVLSGILTALRHSTPLRTTATSVVGITTRLGDFLICYIITAKRSASPYSDLKCSPSERAHRSGKVFLRLIKG